MGPPKVLVLLDRCDTDAFAPEDVVGGIDGAVVIKVAGQGTGLLSSPRTFPILIDILQPNTIASAEALARLGNALLKTGIVLQPIVKPVVFIGETDQDAGRLSVARDDNFVLLSHSEISGQVVLHLR